MSKCDKCGKTDFDDADGCSDYVTYSPAMDQFVTADIEASMYQGKDDLYFTTEWCGNGDLLGWMDMPELPEAVK